MISGKTLKNIVLSGGVAIVAAGCGNSLDDYPYLFKEGIGDEQVEWFESGIDSTKILNVFRSNGIRVQYIDNGSDDVVDRIGIDIGNTTYSFPADMFDTSNMDEVKNAQKDYDDYMAKIRDIQKFNKIQGLD